MSPRGFAVFMLPEHHRKRLRMSNTIKRSVQQDLKRRAVKISLVGKTAPHAVFRSSSVPSKDPLLRLFSAVLVEIDEKWAYDTKAYIKWECQDA